MPTMPTKPTAMPSNISEARSARSPRIPGDIRCELVVLRSLDKRDRHEAVCRVKRAFGPSSSMPSSWAIRAETCAKPCLSPELAEMDRHPTKKSKRRPARSSLAGTFPGRYQAWMSSEERETARAGRFSVRSGDRRSLEEPAEGEQPAQTNSHQSQREARGLGHGTGAENAGLRHGRCAGDSD